jgi:signal transduction histidine kinase
MRAALEASNATPLPDSLAGLGVGAEVVLAAVLEAATKPVCIIDADGVIRFANPAAVAALGHGKRLVGRRSDDSSFPESAVRVPIELPAGRGAVVAFGDAEEPEHEAILAAQRRVAVLVAGGAASADLFAAIAREVGRVTGQPMIALWRYAPDGLSATVLGSWSEQPHPFQAGTSWPLDGPLIGLVLRTGRPARVDGYADDKHKGRIAAAARDSRMRSVAGAPIIVDGGVWGVMVAASTVSERLPDRIEHRLAEFTELVATAISNSEGRAGLARLADEQAALRRVATLAAYGATPEELFAAVVEEVGRVFPVENVSLARFESGGQMTIVAVSDGLADGFRPGDRWPLGGRNVSTLVAESGRSARIDRDGDASGRLGVAMRDRGLVSVVGAPIVVEGRVWGVMTLDSTEHPLPPDTEARLASFAELVATAIANTEARTELSASRARIVEATDEERRRVVRDLHDGAQQRLVLAVMTLKMMQRAVEDKQEDLPALLETALDHAERATDELRELAHGILPAVLMQGGLRAGVQALASRMPIPVDIDVSRTRLPPRVEATAYFIVAEALTNVAKHAHAGRVSVAARVEDGTLLLRVSDDGVGGARTDGTGLLGLADRLAVLDGRLRVESPPDGGTVIAAEIPVVVT